MNATKKDFLTGVAVAEAGPDAAKAMQSADGKDPNLSVFMADIHVAEAGVKTMLGA